MRLVVATLCTLAVCLGCQEKPPFNVTGITGKSVTLVPEVDGSLEEISWKKKGNIVAELEAKRPAWFTPSLKNRTELNETSGALTFEKLYQNDSGDYKAEVLVEDKYQCTFFRLHVLKHPEPPQINCTANNDSIWVSCEVDVQDVAQDLSPTYRWEYQKSQKEIPGNTSVILIPKTVDPTEIVTCFISAYDAEANSSISLSPCVPKGAAPSKRNRAFVLLPVMFAPAAGVGVAYWCWKRGYFYFERKGTSQECEEASELGR